ncbi:MAG: VOC family protein [Bryobacteraceae bacterium]|jgi:catechol 2,3-dioxygenase-like lactoylglutathione lyase family enzyme
MLLFRIFAACLIAAISAVAQPPTRGARNVAMGHIHLNSADPDTAIAFWTEVLGASSYSHESLKGVSLLGAIILFTPVAPSGPSAGSAIDHIGFRVPDLQPLIDKLAKTGYKSFQPGAGGDRLMIDGPDGVRIELIEDSSEYAGMEFDHLHFYSTQPKDMQAWYAKNFGARPGRGGTADSSNIAGTTLSWARADSPVPTAGRAIDHVAFEIKGLEAFCKKLVDNGIKLDSPYQSVPEIKLSNAFLTDPWGTRIELTEGLAP